MSGLISLCKKYFGVDNLYDAIGVVKEADEKQLKKAYYKLSLSVHPDRVSDEDKEEATEKFKVLGKIYDVLTNPKKRELYDESGTIDDDSEGSIDSWLDYWRNMFPPITKEAIDDYKQKYQGSEEEIQDIKKAYKRARGSIDKMHEYIPFLTCEDEPRMIEIVKGFIESGELVAYKIFTNEPESRRKRRHAKYKREAIIAERILKKEKESGNDLIAQIQARNAQRTKSFLDDLENKYLKKSESKKTKPLKRLSKGTSKGKTD